MFGKKCPYCKGKLHIVRTSPVVKYGCASCMRKTTLLLEKGFTREEAERFIKGEVN